jgi:hypothetical protein
MNILQLLTGNSSQLPRQESTFIESYRKLPNRHNLLQNLGKNGDDAAENQKSTNEIVKVIGLNPETLFTQIPAYRIRTDKLPVFSNQFESFEQFIPTSAQTTQNQPLTHQQNQLEKNLFVRQDGRNVLSLPFNPS